MKMGQIEISIDLKCLYLFGAKTYTPSTVYLSHLNMVHLNKVTV